MMELHRVWPSEIDLARLGKRAELPRVPERVAAGELAPFQADDMDLYLLLSVGTTRDTGQRALWLAGLAGSVKRRPKDNLELMRRVIDRCEHIARLTDCTEMRVDAKTRTSWKLRLLTLLGFVPVMSVRGLVMRKGLNDGR